MNKMDFIRNHIKEIFKFMLSATVLFIILCIATYIHELSHATMTEMCGGTVIKMSVFLLDGKTTAKGLDTSSGRIVAVSGSIGAILFGSLIIVMAHNFNSEALCCSGYAVIGKEILYWIFSPMYKSGDFWVLIQTHDNINIAPIITLLWIFFAVICIMLVSSLYKIEKNKEIKKWLI